MSQLPPSTPSSTYFETIFREAVKTYEKRTKNDLASHPLAAKLKSCDTPDAILAVLRAQAEVSDRSQGADEKLTKWLDPIVNVLCAFSEILGNGVALAFPPATVIFTGIGVLLKAVKDVRASRRALGDLFGRIESFFRRLMIYTVVRPTEVRPTKAMTDTIVKILAEVLSILGMVTKEVAEGRIKKYFKRLAGWTSPPVEDAIQELDKLTREEALMVAAENMLIARKISNRVKDVQENVNGVDQSIQSVDLKVQVLDDKVQNVNHELHGVDGRVHLVLKSEEKTTEALQQIDNTLNSLNQCRLRNELRTWISPRSESGTISINLHEAHDGTAAWCTQSSSFVDWKVSGSLLWIHGKPGSGKSVMSSVIIRQIQVMSETGLAHVAYFYFDENQNAPTLLSYLLSSLLLQLSDQSDQFYGVLRELYSKHRNGNGSPRTKSLVQCLKDMLSVAGQTPIYLVLDALDEYPPSRDKVLDLVEELVKLCHPNLRLCVTSCPEYDIRTVLEPLATQQISLHDESEQRQDMIRYVQSIVRSDPRMKQWPAEVQGMVIKELEEKADGMFRWVFCQLEVLRHCPPLPDKLRCTLKELPESLDETYERRLKRINEDEANRKSVHQLLQCLAVAARPLRIEELAEMFAINFGGTNAGLRWENQQHAVLAACSSLVSVITDGGGQPEVVRFTHFSVQQFLTSDRLAKSADSELSEFHISLENAHAVLSHACLNILLHLDEHADRDSFQADPLLPYVAECWVKHVQFKDVELRTDLQDAMDSFFDPANPHFSAWVRIQRLLGLPADSETPGIPWADPLYFAAYCGFRGLVERTIVKHPQYVNACSREYGTLLHSSIFGGHIGVAQLLLARGADVNAPGTYSVTPLHVASRHGRLDAVKWLFDHGADVNAPRVDGQTALHSAALKGHLAIARTLIARKANVSARDVEGCTPLSLALEGADGGLDVVRLLLDSKADVNTRDNYGKSPLHYAAVYGYSTVAQLLLERNAECNVKDAEGSTPLRCASDAAELGLMQLLLDRGADADLRDNSGNTPLHQAAINTLPDVARILLKNNAEVNAPNDCGSTPLHLASEEGELDVVSLLLDYGADIQVRDSCGNTPLQIASANGHRGVVQILLDHEVDVDTQSDDGSMSHFTSEEGDFDAVCASLDRFAQAQVHDNGGKTSSEVAGDWEQQRIVGLLSAEMNE